ncbi:MAG: 2'-5' RNA ligase family protein [Angustibacter sp.]
MARTSLLIALPELAGFTARWRATAYDPQHPGLTTERRFPPHLTLLTPWTDPDQPNVARAVRRLAARHPPLTLRFHHAGIFDDGRVVWLAPEPLEAVSRLLDDALAAFPECEPYDGAHAAVVPHVTVSADAGQHVLAEVRDELKRHGPLTARATALSAYARDETGVWREVTSTPLGTARQPSPRPVTGELS